MVQIEASLDAEENVVRIIGVEEDISQATKEITKFIKEEGINIDTQRPQVSESTWNFLANQVNHDMIMQMVKDLEKYSVTVQIADDREQFVIRGTRKGIELCKVNLSKIAAMIVEKEKMLQYPGIRDHFRDNAGKEHLDELFQKLPFRYQDCQGLLLSLTKAQKVSFMTRAISRAKRG